MPMYKQRCFACKKNWALVRSRRQRLIACEECELKATHIPIEDPEYQHLFSFPQELYHTNPFLRSLRYYYYKHGALTDKQKEALKNTLKEKPQTKKRRTKNQKLITVS